MNSEHVKIALVITIVIINHGFHIEISNAKNKSCWICSKVYPCELKNTCLKLVL